MHPVALQPPQKEHTDGETDGSGITAQHRRFSLISVCKGTTFFLKIAYFSMKIQLFLAYFKIITYFCNPNCEL